MQLNLLRICAFTPFLLKSQFWPFSSLRLPKTFSPFLVNFLISPDNMFSLGCLYPNDLDFFQQKMKLSSKSSFSQKQSTLFGKFTSFCPTKTWLEKFWTILAEFFFLPGNIFSCVVFTPTNSLFQQKLKLSSKSTFYQKKMLIFWEIYDYFLHFCVTCAWPKKQLVDFGRILFPPGNMFS